MEETNWLQETLLGGLAGYRRASEASLSAPKVYGVESFEFLRWLGVGLDAMHRKICQDLATEGLFGRLSGKTKGYDPRFRRSRSIWSDKERWVDGTPENATIGHLLAEAFPNSQFLVLIRDPRDVVASLLRFDRVGSQSYEFSDAIRQWMRLTELSMHLVERLPARRAIVVPFQKIASDPQTEIRRVFDFLGEPWFDQAADTYSVRINSSATSEEERAQLDGPELDHATALFDGILAGTPASELDWGPSAVGSLDSMTNDLIDRIGASVRG
jgi:hypothetical protein